MADLGAERTGDEVKVLEQGAGIVVPEPAEDRSGSPSIERDDPRQAPPRPRNQEADPRVDQGLPRARRADGSSRIGVTKLNGDFGES